MTLVAMASMCACHLSAQKIGLRGGGSMYYEEYGEGIPVVLLHGHTLDRRMWAGQVELLKEKYHVIVPDLRGYGLSSDPVEGMQFTHLDDVLDLMDSLHLEKAHVVGLSMGAFVAGDMVALHPERLLTCVMVSGETCTYTGPSQPRSQAEKKKQREQAAKVARDLDGYKRRRVESLLKACYVQDERVRNILNEEIMDWHAWQALHVTGRIYYGKDAWKVLQERKPDVPSLIIFGAKERTQDCPTLACLPQGRQVVFEECGHMVNIEQPERFNSVLLDWLSEHDPS